MSINVYAWPPVGVIGSEWTEENPVQVSRSLITGAEYRSVALRRRRLARLDVSALARDGSGAGYMEILKRYLAGIHAVRLNSQPVNWHVDSLDSTWRQSALFGWTDSDTAFDWTDGGTPFTWFTGRVLRGGSVGPDAAGFPSVLVSNCPASTLVARPGDFLTAFETDADSTGTTVQVANAAQSDEAGDVTVRLMDALPSWADGFRVNLGTSDTGVFRPVSVPRAVQPLGGNWSYGWEFREVFADEVGGFVEVDPWA